MKLKLVAALALLVLGIIGAFAFSRNVAPEAESGYARTKIAVAGTIVTADIADTEPMRARGLSGRQGLKENEGMLFVFEQDGFHSFWMKDMLFPIDIMWISSEKKVVLLAKNAAPESYPSSFVPDSMARYVLEVPAGFADRYRVQKGTSVSF